MPKMEGFLVQNCCPRSGIQRPTDAEIDLGFIFSYDKETLCFTWVIAINPFFEVINTITSFNSFTKWNFGIINSY